MDKMLDSSSDEMTFSNEEEACLEWREGVMIPFSWKHLWNDGELFFEDENSTQI